MLIAAAPLVALLRQKSRGAAAKAQFIELINDELGLLAALPGTLFVMWGKPVADPLATIFVATIIAINAIKLFGENLSLLLGRAPEPQLMDAMRQAALSTPGVLSVHNLCAEMIGPETVYTTLHIELKRGMPIEQADAIATEVKARIRSLVVDMGAYEYEASALIVFRPGEAIWYSLLSALRVSFSRTQWGVSTDVVAAGDYDGDLVTDPAVWRPGNGTRYIQPSAAPNTYTDVQWNSASDLPVSTLMQISRFFK